MRNEPPKGDLQKFVESVDTLAQEVKKAARTEVRDHPIAVVVFVVLAVAVMLALSLLM